MVQVLVNHYNPEQSCFIFNGIPYYFRLVDVQIITGLRVDGKQVLDRLVNHEIICENAFGRIPQKKAFVKAN